MVDGLTVGRPHSRPRVVMLNAKHKNFRATLKEPKCGEHCAECRSDTDNPANAHCWACAAGFGLEHNPQECRDMLNCVNECVPCADSNCLECPTRATQCEVCKGDLVASGGKCGEKKAGVKVVGKKKEEEKGAVEEVGDAAASTVTDTAGDVENVGSAGAEKLEDMHPVDMADKAITEVGEGNFENVHVLLNPATAVGGAAAAGGIIGYIILVCCLGFCYNKVKRGMLNDWEPGRRLPPDGFSDNIFACKSDHASIWFWSCCCPCIRWADTVAEMGYMRQVVALSIWIFLTVGNSFLMGAGTLILIALGAYYRTRLRASWGLPDNTCSDVVAWCCCMPCAIAQEARHVERARSLGPSVVKQLR